MKHEFCPSVRDGPYCSTRRAYTVRIIQVLVAARKNENDENCLGRIIQVLVAARKNENDENCLDSSKLSHPRYEHDPKSGKPVLAFRSGPKLIIKHLSHRRVIQLWCFLIPPRTATPCVVTPPASACLSMPCSSILNGPILLCFDSKCACKDFGSGAACAQTCEYEH